MRWVLKVEEEFSGNSSGRVGQYCHFCRERHRKMLSWEIHNLHSMSKGECLLALTEVPLRSVNPD